MLKGLNNTWIARGIRRACGLELRKDKAVEEKTKQELKEARP